MVKLQSKDRERHAETIMTVEKRAVACYDCVKLTLLKDLCSPAGSLDLTCPDCTKKREAGKIVLFLISMLGIMRIVRKDGRCKMI